MLYFTRFHLPDLYNYLTSRYQQSLRNRLQRTYESVEVLSTKEQLIMKKRESVKLKESAERKKPESTLFNVDLLYLQPTIYLVSHQRTHCSHEQSNNQEIQMVFVISERHLTIC